MTKKTKKKRLKTVTMKLNKNGTMTLRSTGGYDLRKLLNAVDNQTKEGEDGKGN